MLLILRNVITFLPYAYHSLRVRYSGRERTGAPPDKKTLSHIYTYIFLSSIFGRTLVIATSSLTIDIPEFKIIADIYSIGKPTSWSFGRGGVTVAFSLQNQPPQPKWSGYWRTSKYSSHATSLTSEFHSAIIESHGALDVFEWTW